MLLNTHAHLSVFGKEQFPVVLLTFLPTEAVGKTNPVLWGLCSERKQLHDGATVEVFWT